MKLYNTRSGVLIETEGQFYKSPVSGLDQIIGGGDLLDLAKEAAKGASVECAFS